MITTSCTLCIEVHQKGVQTPEACLQSIKIYQNIGGHKLLPEQIKYFHASRFVVFIGHGT